MEKFKKYLESKDFSKDTIETGCRNLITFFQWLKQNKLNENKIIYQDILSYMDYCEERANQKISVNVKLRYISYYMDFLIEEGKRSNNPVIKLRKRGIVKKVLSNVFSEEELQEFYEAYNNNSLVGKRNKMILGLMVFHGLSSKEIEKLTLHEIDIKKVKIVIPGSRKSNSRELKLESILILGLSDYINKTRPMLQEISHDKSNRLFLNTGRRGDGLQHALKCFILELKRKYPKLRNFKQIRSSVISNWLDKHDERTVQYMGGFKYLSSLERFKQTDLKELQRELELIHPLNDF